MTRRLYKEVIMYHNFEELLSDIKKKNTGKTVAVAAAHDAEVLECAAAARKEDIADFILIGQGEKISEILSSAGESPGSWSIVDEPDDAKAALHAVSLASSRKVDALMMTKNVD